MSVGLLGINPNQWNFNPNSNIFHSPKYVSHHCVQNGCNFVQASVCYFDQSKLENITGILIQEMKYSTLPDACLIKMAWDTHIFSAFIHIMKYKLSVLSNEQATHCLVTSNAKITNLASFVCFINIIYIYVDNCCFGWFKCQPNMINGRLKLTTVPNYMA